MELFDDLKSAMKVSVSDIKQVLKEETYTRQELINKIDECMLELENVSSIIPLVDFVKFNNHKDNS